MDIRLSQQTSQKMVLSPQMRQYLKLLQLPTMELEAAIDAELSENPVLEEKNEDGDNTEDETQKPKDEDLKNTDELRPGEQFEHLLQLQEEASEASQDHSYREKSDVQKIRDFQETLLTKPQDLSDFLYWQIRFLDLSEKEQKIADEIIGNLNDDGLLTTDTDTIAAALAADKKEVDHILEKLQELDPAGVCARNLQEALLLQLKRVEAADTLAVKMLTQHFNLVAKRDWAGLAKQLACPIEDIKKASQIIAKLEPKPGRVFYQDEHIAVAPDVTVWYDDDDGQLKIEVHHEYIPELRISPYYRRMLRSAGTRPEVKNFIREKIQSALNVMNAINLRKSTLHDITETIIKMQPDFFLKGFSHLKPMRLKDISDTLGIHESTVSRALNNKYISTPQGMIPFKSFFSSKLENDQGEDESQKSIMQKIKSLIESENPKKPFSDQSIADTLKKEGVQIARRTVTKYRELLKILPTHLRRTT